MRDYAELLAEFKEWISTDKDIQYLWELNKQGKADYTYADVYAKGIATKWSQMLTDEYGTYWSDYAIESNKSGGIGEIANEIASAYKKAYAESAYYSKNVQQGINKNAGISMKVVEPALDNDRLKHLVSIIADENTTARMEEHLISEQAIETVTRTAVTDTMNANARMQSNAGLDNYVIRDAGAGCCKWCSEMAGKYAYGDQPKDFWAVHAGCTCSFEYKVGKTHTKITYGKSGKTTTDVYSEKPKKISENERNAITQKITDEKRRLEREESNKRIKSLESSTLVDMNYINSNEFRNKLDTIIDDTNERRGIEQALKEMLEHRTGTRFEDLAFIGSKNGNYIINKDFDYYNPAEGLSACKPNKPMWNMLKSSDSYTVIGVHNHPTSGAPSDYDIYACYDRKYKYGIVCGHNGTVYKYTVSQEITNATNLNMSLARLEKSVYNNDKRNVEIARKQLHDMGITIEVI